MVSPERDKRDSSVSCTLLRIPDNKPDQSSKGVPKTQSTGRSTLEGSAGDWCRERSQRITDIIILLHVPQKFYMWKWTGGADFTILSMSLSVVDFFPLQNMLHAENVLRADLTIWCIPVQNTGIVYGWVHMTCYSARILPQFWRELAVWHVPSFIPCRGLQILEINRRRSSLSPNQIIGTRNEVGFRCRIHI